MSRKQVFLSLLFAILAFIFVFSAYANAQAILLNVTAAAGVTVNKDETGNEKSLNAALSNAVTEALAQTMPADIVEKNFSEFAAFLLKDPGAYVQSYKILAQGSFGGASHTLVEAVIAPEQIKQALQTAGLLGHKGTVAKVAVFVDANSVFEPNRIQWWRVNQLPETLVLPANTIGNALTEEGFTFLPATATHARAMQGLRNNIEPLDTDIVAVAKGLEADAVVLGFVNFAARQDRSARGSYHITATMELRVLETATGKILCRVTKEAGLTDDDLDLGATLALMEAAQLAAQDLAVCINHTAAKPKETADPAYTGEARKLTLTVAGQKRPLTDYTGFRRMVTNLEGVSGVNINSLSSDGMRITFDYKGTVDMLVQRIAAFNFSGFTAKMTENGPDYVNYEIQNLEDMPQFTPAGD